MEQQLSWSKAYIVSAVIHLVIFLLLAIGLAVVVAEKEQQTYEIDLQASDFSQGSGHAGGGGGSESLFPEPLKAEEVAKRVETVQQTMPTAHPVSEAVAPAQDAVSPPTQSSASTPSTASSTGTSTGGEPGSGSGSGAGAMGPVADNVPIVMAKTFQTIKETTGVDLAEIMRGETYDAKVTKNVNVTGVDEGTAKAAVVADSIKE